MPIVLITWPTPVRYWTNNGFSVTEYDPGVIYDVPAYVANGMLSRNWARYANASDVADAEAKEAEVELPPLPLKSGEAEEKQSKRKGQQDG